MCTPRSRLCRVQLASRLVWRVQRRPKPLPSPTNNVVEETKGAVDDEKWREKVDMKAADTSK